MKLISATIQTFRLEAVQQALINAGVLRMTVYQTQGYNRQLATTEVVRGEAVSVQLLPKTQILVALADEQVPAALAAITQASRTGPHGIGQEGDGTMTVTPIDRAIRIRDGLEGPDAV